MDQSVAACNDFLPFGEQLFYPGCSAGSIDNTHKFTGYERDAETDPGNGTGNDYAFARYYGSRYGSFFSGDPMGGDPSDPQTLNRYPYVRNNPLTLTDPSGMCADFVGDDSDCGGGVQIGFGIGLGSGGWGPPPPISFPPNTTNGPGASNGTLNSDDPFSGETNGIPNGLQVPTLGVWGLVLPSDPGCFFGTCGGGLIFDATNGGAAGGCVSNFYNSGLGKIIQYLSPASLLPWNPNWKNNVREWTGILLLKSGYGYVAGLGAKAGGAEGYSLATGATTTTASELASLAATYKPLLTKIGLGVAATAAALDVSAHVACTGGTKSVGLAAPIMF